MNKLLILCLIFVLIFFIIIIYYTSIYIKEYNKKQIICNSNKDCSNKQVCQMDIDKQKRCFNKDNMIQRIFTKLIVPSYWSNLKTNTNQNI